MYFYAVYFFVHSFFCVECNALKATTHSLSISWELQIVVVPILVFVFAIGYDSFLRGFQRLFLFYFFSFLPFVAYLLEILLVVGLSAAVATSSSSCFLLHVPFYTHTNTQARRQKTQNTRTHARKLCTWKLCGFRSICFWGHLPFIFYCSSRALIYIFMQNITTTKYKFAQPKKTKKAQRDSDGNHMRVSAKRARRDDTTKSRKQRQQKKVTRCALACSLVICRQALYRSSVFPLSKLRSLALSQSLFLLLLCESQIEI